MSCWPYLDPPACVPGPVEAGRQCQSAGERLAVGSVVTELPPAIPAMESEKVRPEVPAAEPPGIGLPEPAAQAAAAVPVVDAATVARMVSEALFALELDLGAGVPTGVPAAVEPAAAEATVSATEPAAVERERPELTDEPERPLESTGY